MMRLQACLPQSWWEFAVEHAVYCYNRTPLRHLEWQTPYTVLKNEVPDISHLRVFGCSAYVHIPEACCVNKLAPKHENMIYIGQTEGIKAYKFMHISNNQVFTSTMALFDETIFPKCVNERVRGTTHLNEPVKEQPPIDARHLPPQPIPNGSDNDMPNCCPPKHKRESTSDHNGDSVSRTDHLVHYTRVNYDSTLPSFLCLSRSATYGLSSGPFPLLCYLFPPTRALYHDMYYHLTTFPSVPFYTLLLLGPVS